MAQPEHLAFLRRGSGEQCLEVYLDPQCPLSARAFTSITNNVVPLVENGGKYQGKVSLLVRIYANPSLYLSGFISETVLLFGKNYPEHFWEYLTQVFATQSKFNALNGMDYSGNQVRDEHTELAFKVLEEKGIKRDEGKMKEFRSKLVSHPPAGGKPGAPENDVSKDLKYLTRQGRQSGIQFTLTALLNGVEDSSIGSGWGKEEWEKWFSSKF